MIFIRTDDSLLTLRKFSELLDSYSIIYAYEFCCDGTIEWYVEAGDLCFDTDDYFRIQEWDYVETDEDWEDYLQYVKGL